MAASKAEASRADRSAQGREHGTDSASADAGEYSLSNSILEQERSTPVLDRVDVVVAGAGPAGFSAAVAAARAGAKTLLVERYGFLGGQFTATLVSDIPVYCLLGGEDSGDPKPLFGGIPQEFIKRLVEVKGINIEAIRRTQKAKAWVLTDPEMVKAVTQDMVEKAGAGLLLHAMSVAAVVEDGAVKGIITESKSGRYAILADLVVDATGDGDVAAASGAAYGKAAVGEMLPMSLCSRMANVDAEKAAAFLSDRRRLKDLIREGIESGELPKPSAERDLPDIGAAEVDIGVYDYSIDRSNWTRRGEANIWGPHIAGDGTNVKDLTRAELHTRKELRAYLRFLQKHMPGFEDAYLSHTATQIGVRESRRI